MANAPDSWFDYEFPMIYGSKNPTPSQANYSPENVAPLIEFFASVLGKDKSEVQFSYDNNTSDNSDNITVSHPNDQEYLPGYLNSRKTKSSEQLRYEEAAKQSSRLKLFQDESPANIEYFK